MHAVGGVIGGLLTAFFSTDKVNTTALVVKNGIFYATGYEGWWLLLYQLAAIGFSIGWSVFFSFIIIKGLMMSPIGLRVSEEEEELGLDRSQHGETIFGTNAAADKAQQAGMEKVDADVLKRLVNEAGGAASPKGIQLEVVKTS